MALGGKDPAGRRAREVFSRLDNLAKDKSRPVAFRMRTEQYRKLEHAAQRHGMSVGAFSRWLIVQALEDSEM